MLVLDMYDTQVLGWRTTTSDARGRGPALDADNEGVRSDYDDLVECSVLSALADYTDADDLCVLEGNADPVFAKDVDDDDDPDAAVWLCEHAERAKRVRQLESVLSAYRAHKHAVANDADHPRDCLGRCAVELPT